MRYFEEMWFMLLVFNNFVFQLLQLVDAFFRGMGLEPVGGFE